MNITQFCRRHGFTHHGTPTNSWDAFHASGTILMQLWQAPGQRIRDHALPGAYLRVRCFDQAHYAIRHANQRTGYNGRLRSIDAIERGEKGFALMSAPPSDQHGAGEWSKYANLERIYPILGLERDPGGDIHVILGMPLAATDLSRSTADNGQG